MCDMKINVVFNSKLNNLFLRKISTTKHNAVDN
jgi:hypothetical protein